MNTIALGRPAVTRETFTSLDPEWGDLVDIDVLEDEWVGVFRNGPRSWIRTPSSCVAVPAGVRFPLIRWLERGRCVLVDSRTAVGRANGWILDPQRSDLLEFVAGGGIRDVLAKGDKIVVTYFDEGVYSGTSPASEGLAIFDARGRFGAGYVSALGPRAVDVSDCYAACWESDTRIAFFPYEGFPFVSLDVKTFEQSVRTTDVVLHGASAVTVSEEGVLFFGPYDSKGSIFNWPRAGLASVVGSHPGPLRGLQGGRFLCHGKSSFSIVDAAHTAVAADGASPRR